MKLETLAIKDSRQKPLMVNSVSDPIFLSTTFVRNEDQSFTDNFRYSRLDNPNRRYLEDSIAKLENGEIAFCFSSGMAAIHTVIQSLNYGDHILFPDDVFFNVEMLLKKVFVKWGLEFTSVDMSNTSEVAKAIKPNTKLIWIETPSNPMLKLTDIAEIVKIAKMNNVLTAIDNTWPTPVLQNPIELGADIVMHSTTKYFGGHSDVMGGCLVLKENNELSDQIKNIQLLSGSVPSPFDSWLIARGIKTMPLRVKAQSKNAFKLALYLENHPEVTQVYYPGLPSHPQFNIAKKQMKKGFGAMLSVLVKGDKQKAIQISNRLKLFTTATSLGSVESLIEHRESVEGPLTKTPDNLLRISVGLEHIDDLIADWDQALRRT